MSIRFFSGTRPAAAVCLYLAASPATALAAPATTAQLDTITVIGARAPQLLNDVLGDVSVIDRQTLQRAGQSSLAEVLARTHGIEAVDYGGPQANTGIFMRGAGTNQTLILIDGLRINAASSGAGALNAIALNDIERIEILRGAASSLYGADAVGGVINIITRSGADRPFAPRLSLGLGSQGTSRLAASIAGSSHGWRYAVNAGYGQSQGYDSTLPGSFAYNPDRDSDYRRNLSASVGYAWRTGHEVSAQVFHSRVNGGYDNGEPDFNDRGIQSLDGFAITSRDRLGDHWYSTLRLGSTRDVNRSVNAPQDAAEASTISRFRTRQNQYLWQNEFELAPTQLLVLALERLEQRVNGDLQDWSTWPPTPVDYAVNRRNTNSLTGIYTADFDRHHLQTSLRHDRDSQYGGQTTGGVAYGFDLTSNLRASLAANTAFRAPTFNDLYYPDGGNPNLKPEKSRNLEAGLRWQDGRSELGATLYHNRVSDLITGWPTVNIGRAVLQGITFTGAQRWANTTLRASLDLSDPHNADTGAQLPLRARRVLRLAAEHQLGPVQLGAQWYVSSHRYGTGTGNGQRLAGYGRLDLNAAYALNRDTELQLRVNNVFDRDYTLVPDYRTAGASVMLTLSWQPR